MRQFASILVHLIGRLKGTLTRRQCGWRASWQLLGLCVYLTPAVVVVVLQTTAATAKTTWTKSNGLGVAAVVHL